MGSRREPKDRQVRHRDGWLDVFRGLGEALLDVWRAEVDLLWEHWRAWGKNVAVAVALAAVVLFLSFWLSGLLAIAVVHGVMELWDLALWQAALVTAGALLLVMAALALAAYLLARRTEAPVAVTRRRLADHGGWLGERILGKRLVTSGDEGDDSAESKDATGDGAAGEPPAAR